MPETRRRHTTQHTLELVCKLGRSYEHAQWRLVIMSDSLTPRPRPVSDRLHTSRLKLPCSAPCILILQGLAIQSTVTLHNNIKCCMLHRTAANYQFKLGHIQPHVLKINNALFHVPCNNNDIELKCHYFNMYGLPQ